MLTSNLVLSIWANEDGPLHSVPAWRRCLVVNHALSRVIERPRVDETDDGDDGDGDESIKLKEDEDRFQRVRAFCWCPRPSRSLTPSTLEQFKPHYLAVSNDELQVLIVWIHSPHSSLLSKKSTEWRAEVIHTIDVAEHKPLRPGLDCDFEWYMENKPFASSLSWSPWMEDESAKGSGQMVSVLACGWTNLTFIRIVADDKGEIIRPESSSSSDLNTLQMEMENRFGIICTMAWQNTSTGLYFGVYADNSVRLYRVTIGLELSITAIKSHSLDWDSVSGKNHYIFCSWQFQN